MFLAVTPHPVPTRPVACTRQSRQPRASARRPFPQFHPALAGLPDRQNLPHGLARWSEEAICPRLCFWTLHPLDLARIKRNVSTKRAAHEPSPSPDAIALRFECF